MDIPIARKSAANLQVMIGDAEGVEAKHNLNGYVVPSRIGALVIDRNVFAIR